MPNCTLPKNYWKDKKEWTTDYNRHDWIDVEEEFDMVVKHCENCDIKFAKA